VLRDFEASRIAALRARVEDRPAQMTLLFFAVVAVWTMLMSAGAALHGSNAMAVNLTPHVAHFTIILGFLFYPLRMIWIPVLGYLAVFLYPFFQPFTLSGRWIDLPSMTPSVVLVLFLINLIAGLLIGGLFRVTFAAMQTRMRPHSLDLFLAFASSILFALACGAQIVAMQRYAQTLSSPDQMAFGFGPDFVELALNRIARGTVVVATFLLAAIEFPRRRQFGTTVALGMTFPLLAVLQSLGFVLFPMIDVVVLALVISILMPVGIALFACLGGIAIYAAMTGQFLNDTLPSDPALWLLEKYSIIGLLVLLLVVAVKSRLNHQTAQQNAAIRKLTRARDAAGVGLFSINRNRRRYRLDNGSQRMLGLSATGPLENLLAAFHTDDRAMLKALFTAGPGNPQGIALSRPNASPPEARTLRLQIWGDRTPGGLDAAYGVLLDVTEAQEQEATLRDTLTELSTRQDRQRQLFSIVSHELRTPASVMSILIDDLAEADSPAVPRLHRQMREAADQLLSVLDDMRQTVNPEQNLPIKRVPYVPAELAESLRNTLALTARDKGISITLSLGAGASRPRVGDVVRVRQVLTNLLRNAVLHSQGRMVTLAYTAQPAPDADSAPISRWSVEDDGIGIPEDQVERLFQPFERGSSDPRSLADGSGLGLYIARTAVETLGGTLSHFAPAGGGAGYVIHLPEEDAPLIAPAVADTRPTKAAANRRWSFVLAEDNSLVAEVMKARLEKQLGRVRVAVNGREALALVAQEQPDVVITDLFMPELDGDDLVRRLRQQGYQRPIVGLTAAVVGEEMDRFRMAGANVVMRKPLDFKALGAYLAEGFPAADPQS
ncbi:MAG: hypothetical protein RLZZ563_2086, partial [Pseudomonadota bacterium]